MSLKLQIEKKLTNGAPDGWWVRLLSGQMEVLHQFHAAGEKKDAIGGAVAMTGKTGKEAFHIETLFLMRLKRSDRADVDLHGPLPIDLVSAYPEKIKST